MYVLIYGDPGSYDLPQITFYSPPPCRQPPKSSGKLSACPKISGIAQGLCQPWLSFLASSCSCFPDYTWQRAPFLVLPKTHTVTLRRQCKVLQPLNTLLFCSFLLHVFPHPKFLFISYS